MPHSSLSCIFHFFLYWIPPTSIYTCSSLFLLGTYFSTPKPMPSSACGPIVPPSKKTFPNVFHFLFHFPNSFFYSFLFLPPEESQKLLSMKSPVTFLLTESFGLSLELNQWQTEPTKKPKNVLILSLGHIQYRSFSNSQYTISARMSPPPPICLLFLSLLC